MDIEKFKRFPRLHFCKRCRAISRANVRRTYTNTDHHDIICSNTNRVYENHELDICGMCEPDPENRLLLKSGIGFNTSDFFK